jgi:hypothetical protein
MSAAHMACVVCKECCDAVGGKMPSGDEARVLTCVHYKTTFEFDDSQRQSGIVEFNEETKRWKVVTLRMVMEAQEARRTTRLRPGRGRRRSR